MDINRYSPSYGINHKHMLGLADYSAEEIFEILYAIKSIKGKFAAHEDTRIIQGVTVALLFGDTSMRTRSALEIGIRQLGGVCVNLPYSEKDMQAGENFKDIVSVICRFGVGALVTRGIDRKTLNEYCAVSQIPVINSTNHNEVPMQTLCDLFTVWEKKGKLEGLKIAYVGKGGSNAASLVTGAIKCGMEVAVATPKKFALREDAVNDALQYGNFLITENPVEAVKGADIIYTDGYSYHSSISENDLEILKPYQVNASLFSLANHSAYFMHSLPATRGAEVTADVIDSPRSVIFEQAENRLHAQKAVMYLLMK